MKKASRVRRAAGLRDEYDFSRGLRGRYVAGYAEGTNVVVLDADVAQVFRDSNSVNKALRALSQIVQEQRRRAS